MTADVNANVDVNVDTEDRRGLDMSEHPGLPTIDADCNGDKEGNEGEKGKGSPEDDPDASYIFVAENDAVADGSNLNGKCESVEEVGEGDVEGEIDNGAAQPAVDRGEGDGVGKEVPLSDQKEETNGDLEIPNGCQGEVEAVRDGVDLSTEGSKEIQVNVLEPDGENKSLEVSVCDEKAEEDDNVESTVTEESQVTNHGDIAESEPKYCDDLEVENGKNVVDLEKSLSSEAEVSGNIDVAESEHGQSGIAEVVGSNHIAESEDSQSSEAEVISSNNIADTEPGKVEDLITLDVAEPELNRSGNSEDLVEVGSKLDLVSGIEENQDSSTTIPEDVHDVDLNHGRESVGSTTDVSKVPQEASEVEQNTVATSCLVEAGEKLESAEIIDVTLSKEYANGFSAGCAEDGLAEASIVNGISGGPQITTVQNGGSEELRREKLTSSNAEIGVSFPAASDDGDSTRDSKNELNMPVIQSASETTNGHVTYQNGESLPSDWAEECDSNAEFSHANQTSPEIHRPAEVSKAVFSKDRAAVNNESNPVDPVSDTALEVDNGHPFPSDTASEPVVSNGHSHPIHDSEIYETKTETVDEKLKANGSDGVGPDSHCDKEVLIDPDSHSIVMKVIPSPQGNNGITDAEADIIVIKSDEFPALSSDVVTVESGVSTKAANNFVEVHVSAEDPVPREVPRDDGPASESEFIENSVDVKAESEVEESLVVPTKVPADDGPASDSVSVEKPIDVTEDSEAENSSKIMTKLPNGDIPASESEVLDDSVQFGSLQVENKGNSVDDDEKTSEEIVDANVDIQGEASSSSPEGIDGQNLVVEKRPFYYMIRIPRYDNGENLREQIKHAQNQVDEKTKSRDAIRAEMQKQRACCNEFGACLDDAISEETAARDLLKAKRREIDSVLLVINKVKSARDVEEIDSKIRSMEHMLQHETIALKEEKSYIRAIQQLKQTREQLSSSLGKQEGVQEALNQKEEVEERLKSLRKEADQLREGVFKAEGATKIANKKYQDEKAKLNELTMQFRSADDVRQQAYAYLQSLRKQSYDRNKYFWKYKDDAKAAYDLASKGDKDELQSHCINQVDRVMELWNNNDEFRKEYTRCNMRSTLRRLRTLDGRSLGPDEEPPVIPYVNERVVKENIVPSVSTLKQENTVVAPAKTEKDFKFPEKLGDQIKPIAEPKKPAKPAPLGNGVAAVSQGNEIEEAPQQEENKPTKEEAELIRKAEELRKEQEAAVLREQRRMEEKEKAKEAMERKRRNADKAQARAALRAQKEAEQKEKEREKRARKKEKRKAVEEVNVGKEAEESAPSSEIPPETKVSETVDKPMTQTKRSQKPPQFTKQIKSKSIPPLPLRNRSKRRMQTWMWALVAALAILLLFLLGNSGNVSSFGFSLQRFGF